MANEESLLAKIFIVLFVVEIAGILMVSLLGVSISSPALQQFTGLTQNVNSTIGNMINSVDTIVCLATLQPVCSHVALQFLQSSTTPIVAQLIALVNVLIFIVNIAVAIIAIPVWLLAIAVSLVLLLGFVFVVLIPSFMVNVGILGYILGLGYVFVVAYAGYKYGRVVIELFALIIGVFIK